MCGVGVKHSCQVAVGTVEAVFHNRVHMLTALHLWSCNLTAALNKAKSHPLTTCCEKLEKKKLNYSDEHFCGTERCYRLFGLNRVNNRQNVSDLNRCSIYSLNSLRNQTSGGFFG